MGEGGSTDFALQGNQKEKITHPSTHIPEQFHISLRVRAATVGALIYKQTHATFFIFLSIRGPFVMILFLFQTSGKQEARRPFQNHSNYIHIVYNRVFFFNSSTFVFFVVCVNSVPESKESLRVLIRRYGFYLIHLKKIENAVHNKKGASSIVKLFE